MALIKKNIWTLFLLIISILLISFVFFSYKTAEYSYNDFISEQEHLTKITSNSLNSSFIQYEMILDILGSELFENNTYTSLEKSRMILDRLLSLNSSIDAFGLADIDGQLYLTSSNLKDVKQLPNLLQKVETKDSFNESLEKKEMIIGRTYFHNTLKTLVIPIRKAVKNEKGENLAVMTAGINVNKSFDIVNDFKHKTVVFRNSDYYNQLTENRKDLMTYEKPIPQAHIQYLINIAQKKYNLSIEELKNSEKIFTIIHKKHLSEEEVVSSIRYIKRYGLWVATQIDEKIIEDEITNKVYIAITAYLFIVGVLYLLFKNINDYEKRKQKALLHQATHDYLTNLNNRYYLSLEYEPLKSNKPFTLFFIDIDNFKSINDNYGHKYGDLILKEIAHRLRSFKTSEDVLIRYSGDEFMLISHKTKKESVKKLATNIIDRLSEPYFIEQYQFLIGSSIGISQYPLDANNFDEIKRYADIAMYKAKKEKNTYKIFEDSIKHQYLKSSQIEYYLKTAVTNNEIYMMYQPQIDKFGKLHGVEALVRWENEKLGFVPPDEFIKIAERTGIMTSLGDYIIKTSIEEIKNIQKTTNELFELSINISVKQFMEIDFFSSLFKLIENANFDRLRLTLEVTENVFIEDIKYIIELLKKLKENGIKISLDDFGTGYSSLSLLKNLPIDELKIDKSFVDDILIDDVSKNMVESIISIGKKFNLKIVAEGIETLEQKELLESYGCSIFQGYYYSKPLKKNDLLNFIENHKIME